jgi:hypothetical protein
MRFMGQVILLAVGASVACAFIVGCESNFNEPQGSGTPIKTGSIFVQVLDADSNAIVGADVEVHCTYPTCEPIHKTTDSDGWSRFNNIPVARYGSGLSGGARWWTYDYNIVVTNYPEISSCDSYATSVRTSTSGGNYTRVMTPQRNLWPGRPCRTGEKPFHANCCADSSRW